MLCKCKLYWGGKKTHHDFNFLFIKLFIVNKFPFDTVKIIKLGVEAHVT